LLTHLGQTLDVHQAKGVGTVFLSYDLARFSGHVEFERQLRRVLKDVNAARAHDPTVENLLEERWEIERVGRGGDEYIEAFFGVPNESEGILPHATNAKTQALGVFRDNPDRFGADLHAGHLKTAAGSF
jgi:hypothetical protein